MSATVAHFLVPFFGCAGGLRPRFHRAPQTRVVAVSKRTATVACEGCTRPQRNPPCVFRHGGVAVPIFTGVESAASSPCATAKKTPAGNLCGIRTNRHGVEVPGTSGCRQTGAQVDEAKENGLIIPFLPGPTCRNATQNAQVFCCQSRSMLHNGRYRKLDQRARRFRCQAIFLADLVPFVVALNLHRRHLSESQRAMVASNIAKLGEGRPNETASIEAVSQSKAASMLNVGRASVQRAREVQSHGTPELVKAVERGEVARHTPGRHPGATEHHPRVKPMPRVHTSAGKAMVRR